MVSANAGKIVEGKIVQIIGSTFDAEFPEGHLPEIYNAIKIDSDYKNVKLHLTGEVQQHLGGNRIRCVALGSTEGLVRGMKVMDTGAPVTVPVGEQTLGRVFNLLGDQLMAVALLKLPKQGLSTENRLLFLSCLLRQKFLKPVLKLLIS